VPESALFPAVTLPLPFDAGTVDCVKTPLETHKFVDEFVNAKTIDPE
jgi:hypothetical protein